MYHIKISPGLHHTIWHATIMKDGKTVKCSVGLIWSRTWPECSFRSSMVGTDIGWCFFSGLSGGWVALGGVQGLEIGCLFLRFHSPCQASKWTATVDLKQIWDTDLLIIMRKVKVRLKEAIQVWRCRIDLVSKKDVRAGGCWVLQKRLRWWNECGNEG